MFGLRFAPLNIPLCRRLQTAAVAFFYMSFFLGFAVCGFTIVLILSTPLFPLAILYLGWYYLIDFNRSSRGGRRWDFMRRLPIWNYFRDYFPIKMIKTAELDPAGNFIFGYHPHGILSNGAFCCFCTEATNFSGVFPGITPHLLPLMALFRAPLFRDYLMTSGMCDVSKQSCEYILKQKGPGSSIAIVIGGAQETLDARPGSFTLTLKNRRGFCRLALDTGASLVPVYAFGENEIFSQIHNPKGSRLRKLQDYLQKKIGFAPALFYGRGVFQYTFGILPHRRPINVVFGKPIPVLAKPDFTEDDVTQLHALYVSELVALFETHKKDYGVAENMHLTFQ